MPAKWKRVDRPASRQRGIDGIGRDFSSGIFETTSPWIVECPDGMQLAIVMQNVDGIRNGGHAGNAEAPLVIGRILSINRKNCTWFVELQIAPRKRWHGCPWRARKV